MEQLHLRDITYSEPLFIHEAWSVEISLDEFSSDPIASRLWLSLSDAEEAMENWREADSDTREDKISYSDTQLNFINIEASVEKPNVLNIVLLKDGDRHSPEIIGHIECHQISNNGKLMFDWNVSAQPNMDETIEAILYENCGSRSEGLPGKLDKLIISEPERNTIINKIRRITESIQQIYYIHSEREEIEDTISNLKETSDRLDEICNDILEKESYDKETHTEKAYTNYKAEIATRKQLISA